MADRRQIIAEIIAEDKTRSALQSARRKVKRYRDDVDKLNRSLTDEEKAALVAARSIKKMAQEARDAQPKIQGLKKGVESLGISGEALTSVYTLAGFAIGKAAGAILDFARGAMALAIESTEEGAAASERLAKSWENLQIAAVNATIGTEKAAKETGRWADAMDGMAAVLNTVAKEHGAVEETFEWWQGPWFLAQEAIISSRDLFAEVGESATRAASGVDLLSAAQNRLNASLRESPQFQTSMRGPQGMMADFSESPRNEAAINAAFGRGGGGRGGRGAARPDGPRTGGGPARISQYLVQQEELFQAEIKAEAQQKRALEIRRESLAIFGEQIGTLRERMAISLEQANINAETLLQEEAMRQSTVDLSASLNQLATGGIGLVTNALGNMITMLAAGEGGFKSLGVALLGQFGSLLKTVGEGMIGLGAAFSLIEDGTLAVAPGLAIAAGAGLVATGALMEGLAKRGQKAMRSRGSGGGAATAAVDDAVSALGRFSGDSREQGPRTTTLVIGEREMRGYIVDTVNQGQDLGEVGLVPQGAM